MRKYRDILSIVIPLIISFSICVIMVRQVRQVAWNSEDNKVTSKDLYDAYFKWCGKNGEEYLSKQAMGIRLKEKGFTQAVIKGSRGWQGLTIMTQLPHMTYPDTESKVININRLL